MDTDAASDDATRTPDEAARRWETTFGAAADHFDDDPLAFFAHIGSETIARVAPAPGARVLDVACGSGHSAIPAAIAVGRGGTVIGADLAEPLLALARAKAAALGLEQAEFVAGDFRALPYPDGAFDAVTCGFGIFFVPDMEAATAELWRMVASGGRLAITTWGPDLFAPLQQTFWDATRAELPPGAVPTGPPAWARIEQPDGLRELFAAAGVEGTVSAEAVPGMHPVRSADEWWTIVIGSGLRGAVDAMGPEAAARVRAACAARIEADGITEVPTNAVYGIATKPS